MPERLLIFEPRHDGHHLMYVRLLVDAAASRGFDVAVATSEAAFSSDEWATHMGGSNSPFMPIGLRRPSYRALISTSRSTSADVVLVPGGDHIALRLGWAGRWRGAGELRVLVMRRVQQPGPLGPAKFRLKSALLHRAMRAPHVDIKALAGGAGGGFPSSGLVPDPVVTLSTPESVAAVRESARLDGSRYWFGVVGAITARKNVPTVLRAIQLCDTDRIGFVIAGTVDPAIAGEIEAGLRSVAASGVATVLLDRVIDSVEFDSLVAALDCIVVAHSNEGPSGVLSRAAALGTRVVCAGADSLRVDAQQVPDVATWCPLTETSLAEAFRAAQRLNRPAPRGGVDGEAFLDSLLA